MTWDGRTVADGPTMQAGWVSSGSVAAGTVRTINVTFDVAFTVAPVVVPSVLVGSSTAVVRAWLGAVSLTGCTIYAVRDDTATSLLVGWHAYVPTQ